MPSVLCETSSRVHLKFKPSSSFNIEDVVKKNLPDGSVILENRHRNIKKANRSQKMFLAIAQIATQTLPAVGILNTQNNCYINASLQVLLRMPVFGATITKIEHNQCGLQFCMINFLKMVLKKLSRGEHVAISLLIENIRAVNKDFRRGQQEDAHEMILSILEYLRSELRCNHRASPLPEKDAWFFKTIDSTLFTKFRQSIRCSSCGNLSVTNTSDAFVVVGCGASLVMALKQHFGTEVLEGDCAYHCDKCRAKVRATKRLAIDEPGEYFAVQLSRFHYDGYKNSNFVPFPETINLTEFTENPKGPPNEYTLFAAIIHEGDSTRSGHYLSIVKVNNKYKIFNDLDVDDTCWREVQYTRPYIIVYAKVRRIVCANVLKRKLEVQSKEEPAVKKSLNAYNIYSIKTVDNRSLGSTAVAVTTCPSQNSVAKNKAEAFRDERGRISSSPRAAPKLVWHRQVPASAPVTPSPADASSPVRGSGSSAPRKAQVIFSQEPTEEIQNIAPRRAQLSVREVSSAGRGEGGAQDPCRGYRPLLPRAVERSVKGEVRYQPSNPPESIVYRQKVIRPESDWDSYAPKHPPNRPLQKQIGHKDIENRPRGYYVHQSKQQGAYFSHHKANGSFREPQFLEKQNTNSVYKHVHTNGHHYNNYNHSNGFSYKSDYVKSKNFHSNGHHNNFHGYKHNNYKGNHEHYNRFSKEHLIKESNYNGHYNGYHHHHHNGVTKHFNKNFQRKRQL